MLVGKFLNYVANIQKINCKSKNICIIYLFQVRECIFRVLEYTFRVLEYIFQDLE